jgi:hypothetical protein
MGAIALQGPHQGAQKSTSTGTAAELIVSLKFCSFSVVIADMLL